MLDPRAEDAEGRLVARAYSWNTIGAVAGSLVAGFVIAPRLDYFEALYLLSGFYAVTALLALAGAGRIGLPGRSRRLAIGVGAVSLGLTLLGFWGSRGSIPVAGRWQRIHDNLEVLFHEPGIQGVTSVFRLGDREFLVVNGTGMTAKITATKMMAHLPLLVHPDPEDTLVIAFGMGTTYRSAISHGGRVTVVELVPEVYQAFDCFFADADRVRAYPKGKVVFNDGRNFLNLSRARFDVITIDPPPPIDAAGVNNLYSKEFYELGRAHLKPGGIMAAWIPAPGTKAGVDDRRTYEMLVRTFRAVFPEVLALESIPRGIGVHLLGSMQPMEVSPERLARRLADPAVAADLNEWRQVPPSYFQGLAPPVGPLGGVSELNTDDRPRLEFGLIHAWRSGSKKTYPLIW
jgi:spermidine synthase